MNWKVLVVALMISCLGVTAAAAKKHRRHVRPPAPVDTVGSYGSRHAGPAHFVRLPNGLIVSSYQCFTDEGYGRYLLCGAGKR